MVSRDKLSWFFAQQRNGCSINSVERVLLNRLSCFPITQEEKTTILSMIPNVTDWESLIICAKKQQTLPMIGFHFNEGFYSSKISNDILEQAISSYKDNLSCNLVRTSVMIPTLIKLAKELSVILLKGLMFNEIVYRNPGLRPMMDFDILIKKDCLDEVDLLLKEQGFIRPREHKYKGWEQASHHIIYTKRIEEGLLTLEVHTALFTKEILKPDYSVIWKEAQPVEIWGERFFIMDSESLSLYTILTLAMHSFDIDLRRLVDIRAILRNYNPKLEKIWELAKLWGGVNFFLVAEIFMKEYYPEITFQMQKGLSLPFLDKILFSRYFSPINYRFCKYNFAFHRQRLNAYLITEHKLNYLKMLFTYLSTARRFGYPKQ